MLEHGVILDGLSCRLRPIKIEDEDLVLNLWNQDYVIGNLYSGRTTSEVYRKYFSKYSVDTGAWQWVIERKCDGAFCGTIGCNRVEDCINFGWVAMCKNRGFYAMEACALLFDYVFTVLNPKMIKFNVASHNERAMRVYKRLGAVGSGEIQTGVSRYGQRYAHEKWFCLKKDWLQSEGHAFLETNRLLMCV